MAAKKKEITVKHIAKNFICETCSKLEQLKDKVRESGERQSCFCTCGAVQAWPVKEKGNTYDGNPVCKGRP